MTKNTSDNTKELPNDWEWKTVGEVCDKIQTGTTPSMQIDKYYVNPTFNWFSPSDFNNSKVLIDANKKLSSIAVEEGKARIYDENTLLLIAIGGTIGKVAISREKSSSNQQITGIKFKKNVNVDFSYYWFITLKNEIINQASASTLPIINQSGIKNLPFILPPLKEQERIVQKLDTAFQSLDEAITLQKENIAHTQELKKAVLVDTFENLDINCQIKPLSYFDKITSGGTPSRQVKEYWDGSINWFSSGELNYDYISESKEKITEAGLQNSNARIFPAGTLLIGMYDTAAMKMSILEKEASCNQAIVGIKPKEDILNIIFLKRQLEYLKSTILLQRQGVRQLNLNSQKIKDIEISFPPLSEQEKIVAYLDTSFAKLDALIMEQEARLAQLMELKKSVLQEAFEGKL